MVGVGSAGGGGGGGGRGRGVSKGTCRSIVYGFQGHFLY